MAIVFISDQLPLNNKDIFILSIENPAHLYRINANSDDFNAQLVYSEVHPKVFYDAMLLRGCFDRVCPWRSHRELFFSIENNLDRGITWHKIDCKELPAIVEGEAAFAASNSNLAVLNNTVWFVSGGKKARVFKSNDNGKKWEVFETPIVQGEAMTGDPYLLIFMMRKIGVTMGGDYDQPG
ncbi:MAG: hypothetical protein U5K51_09850 [Flavobacteriaceae bacterium]|nr:hypothetical protein [Flavobacteriaceae bacterium]